ncbi:MAG: rod shape-determining protein MreC [Candidatus Magasanikbacteria bacterium CG_4_10_14_0_8_um_filter_32_14]|uniref:Cell shape-determining protein MreC n=2 Tax=Candidatus Magasanikiibacteriota TaxID=1752731 RepID=A0A2M7RA10_9BACT|nr:MAG: rod shape-determining protein MreC [Candidatus Magasanikbacteria bacterium CG1_02_32_51]PIY93196.1 MAG: rod shape-determining protein MreC [Candidatus Magasanikbacteria bacterium CG_4_10_14_0_8_um_filter_32_14]
MVTKSKTATFFTIFFVIIFVVGFNYFHWLDFVEKPLIFIVDWSLKPINKIKLYFKKTEQPLTTDDINTLEQIKEKNQLSEINVQILTEENLELKKQLNFFVQNNFEHVGAVVLSRTVNPLATTIMIDKGNKDGIQEGDPVVVNNGILIGKIIKVEDNRSVVRLINDNNSAIGATIMNRERSIGLVEGGYGLGVRMNYIPQNEVITPGDIIISSGLSDTIPRGLVIGNIEVVDKKPNEPFQQAVITPTADLSYINLVSIIVHKK